MHDSHSDKVPWVLVHCAPDRSGGEFRRVKSLRGLVIPETSEVTEIILCHPASFWKVYTNSRSEPGVKIILPILIPFRRLTAAFKVRRMLNFLTGLLFGSILNRSRILAETHNSWDVARGLSRRFGELLVADFHGAAGEEALFTHGPKVARITLELDRIEAQIMRDADVLICQSEAMRRHLLEKHTPLVREIRVFECNVDVGRFCISENLRSSYRRKLEMPDNVILYVYCGSLAKWQKVEEVLQIFALLKHPNKKLLILTGDDSSGLKMHISARGISTGSVIVTSCGSTEVGGYLNAADIAFLLRDDTVLNRVASPTKLGEYLACGLPVVVSDVAKCWRSYRPNVMAFCLVPDSAALPEKAKILEEYVEALPRHRTATAALCRQIATESLNYHAEQSASRLAHGGRP